MSRRYPSQNLKQVLLRIPEPMRVQLQAAADEKGWSLTAEILARLESTFPTTEGWLGRAQQSPSVRMVKELLALEARLGGRMDEMAAEVAEIRGRLPALEAKKSVKS
ncbi:MAG: Arc family DNA-binding protein [Rhodoblastus sp.]